MTAMRIARAATGRERVVKFAGAYHGHSDGLLAAGRVGPRDAGIPASPGVPAAVAAATVVVPWNDPEALVAATVGRPGGGDHRRAAARRTWGSSPAAEGFLELLRARADDVRRAADLRRGDQRLSRRPRRRAASAAA